MRSVLACLMVCACAQAQIVAPDYVVRQLVKPSAFHGVHGLAFDAQGMLYAGSVVGQSIYRIDPNRGQVTLVVGTPEGMADDLVFLPDGTMVWTAISQGAVRARKGNGPIRVLAELTSVNSINYRKSDGRLYVAQVFGGDGLWELDVSGERPPRNILKDIGGLNGFDIGADGWIYGPLWFKKQVVKINPDSGELKVIADGFHTPAAANFDSKWNLYVLDTALGTVNRVDIATGTKTVVAQLRTSLDNLAIDARDRVFVSNMADNSIQEVNVRSGKARAVVLGGLAMPVGLAAVPSGKTDRLFVADTFAFRSVDGATGRVTDIERAYAANVHIGNPASVSASANHVLVVSGGNVQKFTHQGVFVRDWQGLRASAALEYADGLVLAQGGTVSLVNANGERRPLAADLGRIQGMGLRAGEVVVADQAGGRVLRVALADGSSQVLAEGLVTPQSIAFDDVGVLTVEFGKRRIVRIVNINGSSKVQEVARDLPVGWFGLDRPQRPIGLAVGRGGVIYHTSDIENAIYKLTPKTPAKRTLISGLTPQATDPDR
jgi:sugar lactone lactonase YvrE